LVNHKCTPHENRHHIASAVAHVSFFYSQSRKPYFQTRKVFRTGTTLEASDIMGLL